MIKRRILTKGCILLLVLTIAGIASAREILNGKRCYIAADDPPYSGDLFVLCNELIVEGQVEGHIIGIARTWYCSAISSFPFRTV